MTFKTIQDNREIAPLRRRVSEMVAEAQKISITEKTLPKAVEFLAKIREFGKTIQERKMAITKPLMEALKSTRALFEPMEAQYAEAERVLKTNILAFQWKLAEARRAEEAKLAARVEAGTMRPDTAAARLEKLPEVPVRIETGAGAIQTRAIRKVRILNAALLPRKYLIPDEVLIRKDALAGIEIPAVAIIEQKIDNKKSVEVYEENLIAVET